MKKHQKLYVFQNDFSMVDTYINIFIFNVIQVRNSIRIISITS